MKTCDIDENAKNYNNIALIMKLLIHCVLTVKMNKELTRNTRFSFFPTLKDNFMT